MKLSVSLPDEDVVALDEFARALGLPTRSAAVQRAIRLVRHVSLEQDYEQAWADWDGSGERAVWESALGDGLGDAAR